MRGSPLGGIADCLFSDELTGNIITVQSGTIGGYVYGGVHATSSITSNSVAISGGSVGRDVYGGYTWGGNALDNTVTIGGGMITGMVYGGQSLTGSAQANKVAIGGGTMSFVYGGYSHTSTASSNNVTVSGGSMSSVYGGISGNGTVSSNSVTVSGGSMTNVYGGQSGDGAAQQNNVTISGGRITGMGNGGYSDNGSALSNSLAINGGTITNSVYGGYSNRDDALGNTVTVSAGTISNSVHGGYSNDGSARDNKVVVDGGSMTHVYGGYNTTGTVSSNSVTIIAGTISGTVYGGYSTTGSAQSNIVEVTGGTIAGTVYGARSSAGLVQSNSAFILDGNTRTVSGASSSDGDALNNAVLIDSSASVSGNVSGGISTLKQANANSVLLNQGRIDGSLYGGNGGSGASSNSAVALGGTISGSVYGGLADTGTVSSNVAVIDGTASIGGNVIGGRSSLGQVINNRAEIYGGTIGGTVYGGMSTGSQVSSNSVFVMGGTMSGVYGAYSAAGSATGNSVYISDGTVADLVVGGAGVDATENTVDIYDTANLATAGIFGGYGIGGDKFTGNTLNVHGVMSVKQVGNFENYNFYLPQTMVAGDTALSVTGNTAVDLSGTTVNVGIEGGSTALAEGDRVVLIDATSGINGAPVNTRADGKGMQGVTIEYTFALSVSADQLMATVRSAAASEGAQALSEGFLAGAALVTQGADRVAGSAIYSAVSSVDSAAASSTSSGTQSAAAASMDWQFFTDFGGGQMRLNSGSHVDLNSFTLLAGMAQGNNTQYGRLVNAAFFEYGHGSYDTFNSFATSPDVVGSGSSDYYGGGVLLRMDFNPTGPGHFYADASVRAGRLDNDYGSPDLGSGVAASYDSNATYYGIHLGAGYQWQVHEKWNLDFYAKFLWTHQDGDAVSFKGIDSLRSLFGLRAVYMLNQRASVYAGAAFEYEYCMDADGFTSGFAITAPSLRGGTGIGEIGLRLQPSSKAPSQKSA